MVQACPLTSKLWSETSKLRTENLNWSIETPTSKNFQVFLETFISKFCLFLEFGVITWVYEANHRVREKKVSRRSKKIYEVPVWSFEVSILSSIPNFEVSDQSFEVRHAWTVLTIKSLPHMIWLVALIKVKMTLNCKESTDKRLR